MRQDPALYHGPAAALRRDVLQVLAAGVAAVEPEAAVRRSLPQSISRYSNHRIVVVAAVGKAAAAMARGAVATLAELGFPLGGGLLVTKDGHAAGAPAGMEVLETAHPVPDARSLAAGERLLELAARMHPADLLLVLVSGGASALAEAPVAGIGLAELTARTEALLRSGAPIEEINAERRKLSRLKGGGLARAARGAVLALCLSDVPGDDPEVIGSGPAFTGRAGAPGAVPHVIVASLPAALAAARDEAVRRGFAVRVALERVAGEARAQPARLLAALDGDSGPRRMWIAGGETTVCVTGSGRGGRNQELALAAIPALASRPGTVLSSLGTDGTDGPTDAAGGLVDHASAGRAAERGVDIPAALAANASHDALLALGDLVVTGPTGTNVGDLMAAAFSRPPPR